MRRRDEGWEAEQDGDRVSERRIAVEITLRKVDPLDELVFFVERCAARLEEVLGSTGRCSVTICPVWQSNGTRRFEVSVRFVSSESYAELRHVDSDLFAAVQDAFDGVRQRLTLHRSGVRSRASLLDEIAELGEAAPAAAPAKEHEETG